MELQGLLILEVVAVVLLPIILVLEEIAVQVDLEL